MRWKWGLIVVGLAALLLAGCASGPPGRYRFRMTVEVETPQGLRSGSSVYAVWASDQTKILPEERSRDWGVKGEAVAINLPDGRTLFALLKTGAIHGDIASMSMAALDPAFQNDTTESAKRIAAGQGIRSPAQVTASDFPLLVTFTDLADPKSVVRVDPQDLSATLGPGVTLKRITVEVTDAPVTTGIEKRLGWLPNFFDKMLDGSSINNSPSLANSLSQIDFMQGTRK